MEQEKYFNLTKDLFKTFHEDVAGISFSEQKIYILLNKKDIKESIKNGIEKILKNYKIENYELVYIKEMRSLPRETILHL